MTLCIFAALKFISEVIFILYRTTVMANKDEYIGILIGSRVPVSIILNDSINSQGE